MKMIAKKCFSKAVKVTNLYRMQKPELQAF